MTFEPLEMLISHCSTTPPRDARSIRDCHIPARIVGHSGVILGRFLTKSWITVGKSSYHQLSHNEIAGDSAVIDRVLTSRYIRSIVLAFLNRLSEMVAAIQDDSGTKRKIGPHSTVILGIG